MVSGFRGVLHNSAASHYTFYIRVVGGGARFNIAKIGKNDGKEEKVSRRIIPSLAPPPPNPTKKRKEKRKKERKKRKTENGQRDTGDWVLFCFVFLYVQYLNLVAHKTSLHFQFWQHDRGNPKREKRKEKEKAG